MLSRVKSFVFVLTIVAIVVERVIVIAVEIVWILLNAAVALWDVVRGILCTANAIDVALV